MKLRKLNIPKERTDAVGLKGINLGNEMLGDVVALIGKNGSGKSRLLNIIRVLSEWITSPQIVSDISLLSSDFENRIRQMPPGQRNNIIQSEIFPTLYRYIVYIDQSNFSISKSLNIKKTNNSLNYTNNIDTFQNEKEEIEYYLNIIKFNMREDKIRDFKKFEKLRQEGVKCIETDQFERSIYYETIKDYVESLLDKKFEYIPEAGNFNIQFNLDNELLNYSNLSPGEKVLFKYALIFTFNDLINNISIKESIIFIDEPENHLHPEVQLTLIDKIRKIVKDKGQLWIATHSLDILSVLDYSEMYLMENNNIFSPKRSNVTKIIMALAGYDNTKYVDIARNAEFYAMKQFVAECFEEPKVKNLNESKRIDIESLVNKLNINGKKKPIKILDFGAGKGRLGKIMKEKELLSKEVSLDAFQSDDKYSNELNEIAAYSNIIKNLEEIKEDKYDVIVMVHVFHEINITEWENIFIKLKNSLKDEGKVFIVEDTKIKIGEKPNENGFIVFKENQFQMLFMNKNIKKLNLTEEDAYKDRLDSYIINKNDISINKQSIEEALKSLRDETLRSLKECDSKDSISVDKLDYIRDLVLYKNSTIALERLKQ